ncbi:MAG: hypothetical protein K2X97_16500, partial [Mycobacteriaceae bacterium]|nr:hypothetical protein [Mycobacteriaceae bacterium]
MGFYYLYKSLSSQVQHPAKHHFLCAVFFDILESFKEPNFQAQMTKHKHLNFQPIKKDMIKNYILILACVVMTTACQPTQKNQSTPVPTGISETAITDAVKSISNRIEGNKSSLIEKGVRHIATLWRDNDGTPEDFVKFCNENYLADPAQKEASFY